MTMTQSNQGCCTHHGDVGLSATVWLRRACALRMVCSLVSCLARYQRWHAQFAGDLAKPLDHFFVEWDAVLPPLPFFLVFQEPGIEHPLLSWRRLGLPQPVE